MKDNNWFKAYKMAVQYYNTYGNLNINSRYRTDDGFTLGAWIANQRKKNKDNLLTNEQIELLNSIGMVWKCYATKDKWNEYYKLAKEYYNFYGNLNINSDFITLDGIKYDYNGYKLGYWLQVQRNFFNGNRDSSMTEEHIKLLNDIEMIWNIKDYNWLSHYDLALKYYNHYGNLYMENNFKTKDGINYDSDGFELDKWIKTQRRNYNNQTLNRSDRIQLLSKIGIIDMYEIKYESKNKGMKKVLKEFLLFLERQEQYKRFTSFDDVKKIENNFSKNLYRR